MTTRTAVTALFATALMLGSAFIPAWAIDVNLGGLTGTTTPPVTATVGGNNNVATVGVNNGTNGSVNAVVGGDNNVATVGVDNGTDTGNAKIRIGNTPGKLVNVDPKTKGTTTGDVNLGSASLDNLGLNNLPLDPLLRTPPVVIPPDIGPLPPQVTPPKVDAALSSYSSSDQTALRTRCQSVIASPVAYDTDLVRLCLLLQKLTPNS